MTAPAPAHPHAHAAQRPDGYARRRPEETVLYQTIAAHWPSFSERLEEHGGLPRFVEREFEAYLRCGILDFGFLELECRQCGHSQLVALSCKKSGWCPSCLARRMSDRPCTSSVRSCRKCQRGSGAARSTASSGSYLTFTEALTRPDRAVCDGQPRDDGRPERDVARFFG
jgi:hypothetical protein